MTRPLLIAMAAAAALAAGACGDDSGEDGGGTAATTNPTASAPSAPAPPADATTPGAEDEASPQPTTPAEAEPGDTGGTRPEDGGGADTVSISADFSITGAEILPPSVSVPPFVPIDLTLKSGDGKAHMITLKAEGQTYRVESPAGGSPAATRIPAGQPRGTYEVRADQNQLAELVVGGEPGP